MCQEGGVTTQHSEAAIIRSGPASSWPAGRWRLSQETKCLFKGGSSSPWPCDAPGERQQACALDVVQQVGAGLDAGRLHCGSQQTFARSDCSRTDVHLMAFVNPN
jgi:hypothetical protein